MEIRSDRGWMKAGLAVLVTGVLGGGVIAVVGDPRRPHRVTADGVTGSPAAAEAAAAQSAASPLLAPASEKKSDPEVGEKVMVGDDGGSVTVSAVEDNVSAGRLFGAGAGNKYIAAEVKGCSGPNEKNITFEPAYFLLRLDDGTIRDPGAAAKKPSLEGGTVPPGRCLSGWVTFTVKDGALATAVIYDGSSRLTWTLPLPKNAKPTTTTTMKAGATTTTTAEADRPKATTSTSTKPKTTSTTAKTTATTAKTTATTARTTATTARSSTATTAKPTTTTTKPAGSTTTTARSQGSTTTPSKSGSSTTSTTSSGGKSTGSTTTTDKG